MIRAKNVVHHSHEDDIEDMDDFPEFIKNLPELNIAIEDVSGQGVEHGARVSAGYRPIVVFDQPDRYEVK